MPVGWVRLEHEANRAVTRCRILEWEVETWLRSHPALRVRQAAPAPDEEDLLDREFARLMLEEPQFYPDVRGMPFASVVQLVRDQRLNVVHTRRSER